VAANVADFLWFFGPLFYHQEIEIEIAIMRIEPILAYISDDECQFLL
jgi:hypothetical protein